MSFVRTAPELVSGAAGNLSGIGSTLTQATAAAAGPTTALATAAADEVSVAIAKLFGGFGQDFQEVSTRAAAFHAEFLRLIDGGAAAYVAAEVANAQQTVTGLSATGVPAPAAPLDPILGGLGPIIIGNSGSGGGLFGSLQSGLTSVISGSPLGPIFAGAGQQLGNVLSGFAAGDPLGALQRLLLPAGQSAPPAGNAYQQLFAHTNANLATIVGDMAERPFPALTQFIANQQRYANIIATDVTLVLQDFPNGLAHQASLGFQTVTTADYQGALQDFLDKQAYRSQITNPALQNFATHVIERLPVFANDLGSIGHSVSVGDYHGAVDAIPRSVVRLLLDGVNIDNLSTVNVHGPAGDLLPLLSAPGSLQQDLVDLLPPGTIPRAIGQHFVNATGVALMPVGSALIGWPIATLDGLATGATAFGSALQAGNAVGALGALIDMPAYVLDGFLNGNVVVDIPVPLTATVTIPVGLPGLPPILTPIPIGIGAPVVLHVPFTGILTSAQPISATLQVPIPATGANVPLTITVPGLTLGGAVPALLVDLPRAVAGAISSE
ncbi:PE family protein [Mycobacterium asiaticum]|uniref:PE family protein n=1 Tax=Mycobacterium asiaticum TaxID=1790 RepID=UPI000565FB1F|nr:PE family protein [Mycobacterium asiaticum]ORA10220.1 PE family protein [Mycobacterium asiaticum DSM 44297]